MKEVWKDIKSYEGMYQVSDLGRVRSLDRFNSLGRKISGKILSPSSYKGYKGVNLCKNSIVKYIRLHTLVANAFLKECNYDKEVNHIDFDRSNNKLSNLEYVTHRENMEHSAKNGRMGNAYKMDEEQIFRILIYANNGIGLKTISNSEGLDVRLVSRIVNRQINLPIPLQDFEINNIESIKKPKEKLDFKMKYLRMVGFSLKDIAYLFDMDFTNVSKRTKKYKNEIELYKSYCE